MFHSVRLALANIVIVIVNLLVRFSSGSVLLLYFLSLVVDSYPSLTELSLRVVGGITEEFSVVDAAMCVGLSAVAEVASRVGETQLSVISVFFFFLNKEVYYRQFWRLVLVAVSCLGIVYEFIL